MEPQSTDSDTSESASKEKELAEPAAAAAQTFSIAASRPKRHKENIFIFHDFSSDENDNSSDVSFRISDENTDSTDSYPNWEGKSLGYFYFIAMYVC